MAPSRPNASCWGARWTRISARVGEHLWAAHWRALFPEPTGLEHMRHHLPPQPKKLKAGELCWLTAGWSWVPCRRGTPATTRPDAPVSWVDKFAPQPRSSNFSWELGLWSCYYKQAHQTEKLQLKSDKFHLIYIFLSSTIIYLPPREPIFTLYFFLL
jgi:hypothetical protein